MKVHHPSELRALRADALAQRAIDREDRFKDVVGEFERRRHLPPDESAAAAVVSAYAAGRAPPWLAAVLIGAIRHPVGYPTVLSIIRDNHRSLAESYAPAAIVKIVGRGRHPDCLDDLIALLRDAPETQVRCTAARTLGLLGAHDAIPALFDALRGERIVWRAARFALTQMPVDDDALAVWLRGDAVERRAACEVVVDQLDATRRGAPGPSPSLRPLVLRAIDQGTAVLLTGENEDLRAWAAAP